MASRKNKRPQLLNYFTSKRPWRQEIFPKLCPHEEKAGCILCQGRRRLPHNCTAAHKVDLGSKISIEQHNNGRRYILPVVFRIVEDGRTFWDVRPSKIARELTSRRWGGLSVEASIPTALLKNEGKIRTVPYRYSDQQILEKLRHLGVISVRRQYSLRKSEDGGVVRGPRSVIVLTFKEGVPLPTRVMLGDRWYPVEEYLEPPLQCYNCLRYGHCYKVCRGTIRCRNCAGPHHIKECTRRDAAFAQRIRKFRIEEELAE
ncbi:hypothetical protein MRX96_058919 [Rhipicephalus microplus]